MFDGRSLVAVRPVGNDFLDRYGIVEAGDAEGDVVPVTGATEKPGQAAPSNLGLVGHRAP